MSPVRHDGLDPSSEPPAHADRFLLVVAVDGEVGFAGPGVPRVLGFDRGELIGTDLLDRVHPDERRAVSDALSAVATTRRVVHRVTHANGGYVWVQSVVDEELAPGFGGRVVTARCVDIDRTFPERFREFLEYGRDIVTVVDEDGRVRYESPSVEEVLGYEQGSLVGRSPLGYIHPEDRERVTEDFYRALSHPDECTPLEYRYRTAADDWVWLESRTRGLPDDAVGRLLINSRDVTERKRRERRIADRNERLDRFASIVSHDLKDPLQTARAITAVARSGDEEALDDLEEVLDRMEVLIDDVLTLSKQGQSIGETEPVSIESTASDAWGIVGEPDATLLTDAGVGTVTADPDRLRTVFENLFRNAIEHSERHVTISVGTYDNGIYVEDDGPGIPENERSKVFTAGYTTKKNNTGHGLKIIEQIVKSHDWNIEIEEGSSGGARFEIAGIDFEPQIHN